MGHLHLHPSELGLIQLMPLIVWGDNTEFVSKVKNFIKEEFGEYINILQIEEISKFEDIINDIFAYNYHVIHLTANQAKLIKINSEELILEFEEIEKTIGCLCRELIRFYHENKENF